MIQLASSPNQAAESSTPSAVAGSSSKSPAAPAASQSSYLEIDLGRVMRNVRSLRSLLAARPTPQPATAEHGRPTFGVEQRPHAEASSSRPPRICGVVKKDAYGLGAAQVAPRLVKAGCDMLTVFSVAEAEELVRHAAVTCPILLMMPLRRLDRRDLLYRAAVAGRLHLAIHDREQLRQVNAIGRTFGIRWPVHLYLDTGMSRSGLNLGQFAQAVCEAADWPHVQVVGVYSHFATADEDADFARQQFGAFTSALAEYGERLPRDVMRHIANSCGLMRDHQYHLDMVRPGLALYGYGRNLLAPGPTAVDREELPRLEPALRWVSRIIHVQRYRRGALVGYGCTHRLERDSVLGVVPVGYGEGYPLALGDRAVVRVHPPEQAMPGFEAKVLGRVNMDQIVIDLTDAAAAQPTTLMSGAVEVISNDPAASNALPALARLAASHPYEMLCRLSAHLPRRYVHGE